MRCAASFAVLLFTALVFSTASGETTELNASRPSVDFGSIRLPVQIPEGYRQVNRDPVGGWIIFRRANRENLEPQDELGLTLADISREEALRWVAGNDPAEENRLGDKHDWVYQGEVTVDGVYESRTTAFLPGPGYGVIVTLRGRSSWLQDEDLSQLARSLGVLRADGRYHRPRGCCGHSIHAVPISVELLVLGVPLLGAIWLWKRFFRERPFVRVLRARRLR